ncbi:MAG: HAMP domain-containing sensor histidine kinase [Cyanobacteria bacterium P01_F01_bin.4]
MVDQFVTTISSLVALGEFVLNSPGDSWGEPVENGGDPLRQPDPHSAGQQTQRVEGEWSSAIAAVSQLLRSVLTQGPAQTVTAKQGSPKKVPLKTGLSQSNVQGVLLSGPFPVLDAPQLTAQLSNWAFVPQPLEQLSLAFSQLMPAEETAPTQQSAARILPLIDADPLVSERFCLLLTHHLSLVLVLGRDANGELHFQFSFTPKVIQSVWQLLRSRIVMIQPKQLAVLDPLVAQFEPQPPDYRLVSQFSRLMLYGLPEIKAQPDHSIERPWNHALIETPPKTKSTAQTVKTEVSVTSKATSLDSELLKAMAHEIRTPLTTIRTLTRSVLRRQSLDVKVKQRLTQIDRECTQQIDRFNLIFKAVELQSTVQKTPRSPLTATPLTQLFQESIPQWQQAATRRNLDLEVILPPNLPMVASDPNLLRQVLTGLVELFTHTVPTGSHIQLQVISAGHQIKLQFQSQPDPQETQSNHCH